MSGGAMVLCAAGGAAAGVLLLAAMLDERRRARRDRRRREEFASRELGPSSLPGELHPFPRGHTSRFAKTPSAATGKPEYADGGSHERED